jgi:hypothetical protein
MRYIPSESEREADAVAAGKSGQAQFRIGADGRTITCLTCMMTSHHPDDVRHRYCGRCQVFHPTSAGADAQPDLATNL